MTSLYYDLDPQTTLSFKSDWEYHHVKAYESLVRQIADSKICQYFGMFGTRGEQERLAAVQLPEGSIMTVYCNEDYYERHMKDLELICQKRNIQLDIVTGCFTECYQYLRARAEVVLLNGDFYTVSKDLNKNHLRKLERMGEKFNGLGIKVYLRIIGYTRSTDFEKYHNAFFKSEFQVISIEKVKSREGNKRLVPLYQTAIKK